MQPNIDSISADLRKYLDELRIRLAYRISVAFLFVFLILTYAYYFDSLESFLTMSFGATLCLVGLIIIHYTKNYTVVFLLYSTLGVCLTSYALICFHETIHLVDMLWMLAGVSIAFFSIGKKMGFFLLVVSLVVITYFVFFSLNKNIETVKPRTIYQNISMVIEMLSGFVLNFYIFYLYMNVHKYSETKLREINQQLIEQNIKIQQQNNEKTTLVKEIHHRVKNNLQIVVSLLRLQSSEINDDKMKKHFQESINRIMAMALIHQKLYQNESLSQVKFSDYASDLIKTIVQTDAYDRNVNFRIHSEIEKVGLQSLIPIGLILNELVSNSLKHAFTETQEGIIDLTVSKETDCNWLILIYKDNGHWKKPKSNQSFGMILVETLVEQLEGKLILETSGQGTSFTMRLQNLIEPDVIA